MQQLADRGWRATSTWRRTPLGRALAWPLRRAADAARRGVLSLRRGAFRAEDTVFLTGTARSGTTWLADLLCAGGDASLVFQPIVSWRRHGVATEEDFLDYRAPDTEWPTGRQRFGPLMEGRGVPSHAFVHSGLTQLARSRRLVVKSVAANKLLPWIAANVTAAAYLLIVRHPCAVVASLERHGTVTGSEISGSDLRYVNQELPALSGRVRSLATTEERLAVRWCCEQHATLRHLTNSSFSMISYEWLILEGLEEVRRQVADPDTLLPGDAGDRLRTNSRMTGSWSVDHAQASAEERLGSWKRHLDPDRAARVLEVVHAFGIRGYGEDPVPDRDAVGVQE